MNKHRVYIHGWKSSRLLVENEECGKIKLEIRTCQDHCPDCSNRENHVAKQLSGKNILYHWETSSEPSTYIVLPHPGGRKSLTRYLSKLLRLKISYKK